MKNDLMKFGEHKGKSFEEIPESYKLSMWAEFEDSYKSGGLKNQPRLKKFMKLIEENLKMN